jgi:hypothetical protein
MLPDTQYKTEINIKFGELAKIVNWCQEQCISNWGYNTKDYAGSDPGKYMFYFDRESDYINFILWKK